MITARSVVSCSAVLLLAAWLTAAAMAGERTESFDRDPGWEGRNNRASRPEPRMIRQDFGFSMTRHAGGHPGELGGFLNPAGEPAYYATPIPPRTFHDSLSASGKFAATGRQFHALIGYFRAGKLGGWRNPNTIALRVYGRGDVFFAYVEYCTGRYRAGGDSPRGFTIRDPETGRDVPRPFDAGGALHTWSLHYDPDGHDGGGSITATIDDQTAICHLASGHQADGARFDRFGLLNVIKSADSGGEIWLDDLTIDGRTEMFDRDPGWEGRGNRTTFRTFDVRPRFDFGFSPTQLAGGQAPGELGGLVFRGDGRSSQEIAWYADRLEPLRLDRPIRASGLVSLRRAVSDSTTLLGFFRAEDAAVVSPSQKTSLPDNFLGLSIEGPSREGFLVYPVYRLTDGVEDLTRGDDPPHILPDGSSHRWSLAYDPPEPGSPGRLTVTLDDEATTIPLDPAAAMAEFDRFGIVTTRIDGNSQRIYFDDLTYTDSRD